MKIIDKTKAKIAEAKAKTAEWLDEHPKVKTGLCIAGAIGGAGFLIGSTVALFVADKEYQKERVYTIVPHMSEEERAKLPEAGKQLADILDMLDENNSEHAFAAGVAEIEEP